ncbi:MAG TPA: hypothetical protein DEB06_09225 [Phycisphaerales bacterium]|nr:hypothetical protein [Phycisphaerales bacterium]
MATSPEAFNQVRNILRKLDQSIDAARQRRLDTDPVPVRSAGGTPPAPRPEPVPGRARPMAPRSDRHPGALPPRGM